MSAKSGDQQARAELLAELLLAAGEQPLMLRQGLDQTAYFLCVLACAKGETPGFTLGGRDFLALPLEAGAEAGAPPAKLRAGENWNATTVLWAYRRPAPLAKTGQATPGTVRGTVVDAAGKPLPHEQVRLQPLAREDQRHRRAAGSLDLKTESGADGGFTFTPPAGAKNLMVSVRRGERVVVAKPHVDPGEDIGALPIDDGCVLAGRVTGPDHQPLAGATVRLELRMLSGCTHWVERATAPADATGAFRFDQLGAGTYRCRIEHAELTSATTEIPVASGFAWAELRSLRGGAVEGRVNGPDGKPLAGATVEAGERQAVSDAAGRYHVGGLEDQGYQLRASAPGLVQPANGIPTVTVQAAGTVQADLIALEPAAALRLNLVAGSGLAALPAEVAVEMTISGPMENINRTVAVTEGAVVLGDLPPGTWRVTVSGALTANAHVQVALAGGKEAVSRLVLDPVHRLTGRVADAKGQPVADAAVEAEVYVRRDGDNSFGSSEAKSQTDANGGFVLELRDLGDISLTVKRAGLVTNRQHFSKAPPTAALAIVLQPGSTVSGVVRDENGQPLEGAAVEIHAGQDSESVASGADGAFRLEGVPAGRVQLAVSKDGYLRQQAEVEVATGAAATRDLVLKLGLIISGTLLGEDGKPVGKVNAWLNGPDQGGERDQHSLAVAEDGAFTAKGLAPGTYKLTVMDENGEELLAREGLAAGVTGLDLRVPCPITLAVTVNGPDGKPVAGATVTASRDDSSSRMRYRRGGQETVKSFFDGVAKLTVRRGPLVVEARKEGFPVARLRLTAEQLAGAAPTATLAFPAGLALTGTVTGAAGRKLFAVAWDPLGRLGGEILAAPVRDDGGFTLAGLPTGPVGLGLALDDKGRHLLVAVEAAGGAAPVALPLPPLGSLRGTVPGARRAGEVFAIPQSDRRRHYRLPHDGAGAFAVKDLPVGAYLLYCRAAGREGPTLWAEAVVTADAETVAEFGAGRCTVSGTVAGGTGQVCLVPGGGVPRSAAEAMLRQWGMVRAEVKDGAFTLNEVVPGPVQVLVDCSRGRRGSSWTLAVTVAAEGALVLTPPPGQLTGVLHAADGQPLAEARVIALPAGGRRLQEEPWVMTHSDEAGRFDLRGLPPGPWDLEVMHENGRFIVTGVAAGAEANLVLPKPCPPELRVAVGETERLAQTTVALIGSGGNPLNGTVGADGAVRWETPPGPGTWRLAVTAPGCNAVVRTLTLPLAGEQTIALGPSGEIAVRLRGPVSALRSRLLTLQDSAGAAVERLDDPYLLFTALVAATLDATDAVGEMRVTGLAPGRYRLGVQGETSSAEVEVVASGVAEVELAVKQETAPAPPKPAPATGGFTP